MSIETSVFERQDNDSSFDNVWQELKWRGMVHVSTDEEALEKALSGESLTFYCGFDPTAPSLHLGHLVQLLMMRRLQMAGHKPLGLVGGSTGLIGDPRQTQERTLNTKETVAEWVDSLREQVRKYISFEGDNAARMVNNLDWTGKMSALDFLRDIGKYFRVGTMIKKDIVAKRLESDEGISYTEFSYQILQGLDYLALYREYGCTLQTGGSDQWGNLTSGTELIRKVEDQHVHAIGTPLITNADGTKFGKSEGNAIWLNPEMCSPYAFYQFWLNTADADVIERLKVFTFFTRSEIQDFEVQVAEAPHKREAQRALAWEVTALVHGKEQTQKVLDASAALFGRGDITGIDEQTLESAVAQLPHGSAPEGSEDILLVNLLVNSGLCKSNSDARRTIGDGGVSVNNVKVHDADAQLTEQHAIHDRFIILKRGKKHMAVIDLKETPVTP